MIDFNKYFIVGTNSDALHDTMNGTVIGELIRCKDCRNKEDCQWHYYSDDDYGYCKWAERRGEEEWTK